ncbi:MAG TPA: SURF1 family cytochrome oxidase biogenesis protein [Hyphomicrobiaceae bacterium]|nr:SURF1 family cytochrome oxidase biogenesis protein [Hyphomicrobiaceae bacterium]
MGGSVPDGHQRGIIRQLREERILLLTVLTLGALAVLLALGTWQLRRKAWKEAVIAAVAARASAPPLSGEAIAHRTCRPLSEVGLEVSCEFIPVRLIGRFDHARERHVYTSQATRSDGSGGPGYWIMTPLLLADGRTYIVNRGFVPNRMKDPASRGGGNAPGETEVIGLLRSSEPRTMFMASNDPGKNVWFLRNVGELYPDLAANSGGPENKSVFIDQISAGRGGQLPVPTGGDISISNRHLEYALTWFGTAAALLGTFIAFLVSRLGGRKSST